MIGTQEIKEAIKEIVQEVKPNEENYKEIKEQNEGNIKNVQEVFELNPWLLEKLTDEQLKTEFIKLLYNREHLTGRLLTELREKHLLSEENKILGKMVLEIVLKYSGEHKTDLEIFGLLCERDWRKKMGFSVDEKGVVNYQVKPQEIVEDYYLKQNEEWEERSKFRLEEMEREIKMVLEKEVSNWQTFRVEQIEDGGYYLVFHLDKGVRYKNKEITRICVSKCYPFDSIRHLDKIEINLEEVKNVLFEEVGKDEKKDKKFHYGTNHVRKYSPLLNEIKELCKESGQKELLIKQLQEENKKLIGQINSQLINQQEFNK